MSLPNFYANQCVILKEDIDQNCEAGDLAKIVAITNGNIFIQYSTERGIASKPILVSSESIEPFHFDI